MASWSTRSSGTPSFRWCTSLHPGGGAGTAPLTHLYEEAATPEVFSSTNVSNAPMYALFRRLGWEVGGLLHHLDDGDPEIVYVRLPT